MVSLDALVSPVFKLADLTSLYTTRIMDQPCTRHVSMMLTVMVFLLLEPRTTYRRDMLEMKKAFSGSFDIHCQEKSVPTSLLASAYNTTTGTPDSFLHAARDTHSVSSPDHS